MRVLAVMGLVLFLLAPPAVSQVPDDKLIVPGQRIGKWALDLTIGALVEMNGAPNVLLGSPVDPMRAWFTDSRDDIWGHWWANIQFAAATRGRDAQRVEYLFTGSSAFRTDKNIAPGATRQAMESAYGPPTAVVPQAASGQQRLIYDEIGLGATVARDGVTYLFVFRPTTARTLWNF